MILDPIHPDDRQFSRQAWTNALAGENYDQQHRLVVDGKVEWIHQRAEIERSATDGRQ